MTVFLLFLTMVDGDMEVFVFGDEEQAKKNMDDAKIVYGDYLADAEIVSTLLNSPVVDYPYLH